MILRSRVVPVATAVLATFCLAGGCRSAPEAPPAPPNHRPPVIDIAALLASAERANASHLVLDYKRPFERADVGDSPAVALYLDACRAGHKEACWLAMQIARQDAVVRDRLVRDPTQAPAIWREAAKLVEANCLAGHHTSCLALPPSYDAFGMTFATAPGAAGRSRGCREYDAEKPACSESAVRSECEAGFASSCRSLAAVLLMQNLQTYKPGLLEASTAASERTIELGINSCREQIVDHCIDAAHGPRADVHFEAAKTSCELDRACYRLAELYLERGDTLRARDAAERGCQFFWNRCAELGVSYLDGKFPEPVPGRGQQLVNFVCEDYRRSAGEEKMLQYKPCLRAKLPAR